MAVTILERPKGYVLGSEVSGTITAQATVAVINSTGHGLTTGDFVYVDSTVYEYNGFHAIEVFDANVFRLRNISDTDYVDYISDATTTYHASTLTHGCSCVHLPITYKLTNTLWPVNSVDTARTILTLDDDLGYARITLSGTLGTFEDLSFVKISGASNSDFDGVYQILDKLSTTNITLNVAYSTFNGTGLLGATIQLYYGNYNVVVRVYAGINATHEWTALKPYELATTLELIPDDNNEVFFSINEILKAYVESKNNLLIASYPNNTDAWANFYIEIAEQYDSSNGYTVGTTLSSFTSDQSTFEGTAVNAVLPFKNIHSGSMSEYIINNSTSKFLTLFERPVIFSCGEDTPECYTDISFLLNDSLPLTLKKEFASNGAILLTELVSISEDAGVIRSELEANCNYDTLYLTLVAINNVSSPSVNRNTAGQTTLDVDLFIPAGQTAPGTYSYSVQLSPTVSAGDSATATFTYFFADGTNSAFETIVRTTVGTTSDSGVALPTPEKSVISIRLSALIVDAVPATLTASILMSLDITSSQIQASETKQFDIECGCSDQDVMISWLNPLSGFEPAWKFTTETGKAIDILSATETTKNIFPEWPKSYGEFSDTIRKQVSRESTNRLFFTTQYLTEDQADAVAYIKTSPLVQIVNSRSDRRTIIVDTDSFNKYTDNQKLITISFSARYTDNIGSQKV